MLDESEEMDAFLNTIVALYTEIEAFMEESVAGELGKKIKRLNSAIDEIIAERVYH